MPNRNDVTSTAYDDYFTFFLGALSESNAADLPCEPFIVEQPDFLANLADLAMIYPEIAGVIFFRGFSNYEQAKETLERQQLPYLYYGPNLNSAHDPAIPAVYHDEAAIAALLADFLAGENIRRVIGVGNRQVIGQCRLELFAVEAERHGIEFSAESPDFVNDRRRLRRLAAEADAFFCTVDMVGIELMQLLERELRLRIPDDIRVIGIDNAPASETIRPGLTTVDLCNFENGRLCLRRLSEAIIAGSREPFKLNGSIRLIRRESC